VTYIIDIVCFVEWSVTCPISGGSYDCTQAKRRFSSGTHISGTPVVPVSGSATFLNIGCEWKRFI